jgi:hypothetical protein
MREGTKLVNVSNGLVSRFIGFVDGMYAFVDASAETPNFSGLSEDQQVELSEASGYSLIEPEDFMDMLTLGEFRLEA